MKFKRLFTTTKNKVKQTRVKLTHHQKGLIKDAISLAKIKKAYLKRGYKLPE